MVPFADDDRMIAFPDEFGHCAMGHVDQRAGGLGHLETHLHRKIRPDQCLKVALIGSSVLK